MPVWLFWSAGRKRKGIYPWPLYWRIPDRILLSGTGGTALCTDDDTGCKSRICIGNPVFCCNHVSDRMDGGTYFPRCDPESVSGTFFQNEKRDSLGGHSQWCIVRGGTFDKYFTGSDGDKCDDPGDQRCLSGCDLWRCLCPVRKYLACNDFSCTGRFRKSDGQRNFWNWNNCGTDQPDVCR